jgi:hypothetical protein
MKIPDIERAVAVAFVAGALMLATVVDPDGYGRAFTTQEGIKRVTQENSEEEKTPVALYSASLPADPAKRQLRQARSSRFDEADSRPLAELSPRIEVITLNSEWEVNLPALPVDESDAIVLGDVTEVGAYLSSDKSSIYSEFTVSVKDIVKNYSRVPVMTGSSVSTTRRGGAVRLPDGRLVRSVVSAQNLPRKGRQYVFFLRYNDQGQDFSIVTAYRLRNAQITALDDVAHFAAYKGTNQKSFFDAIQRAVVRSSHERKKEGEN